MVASQILADRLKSEIAAEKQMKNIKGKPRSSAALQKWDRGARREDEWEVDKGAEGLLQCCSQGFDHAFHLSPL